MIARPDTGFACFEMDNVMASVLNVLIASALFVVVLCTVLYLLRWVVRYEINGEAIRIKLLGIATIRQITIREIEAINGCAAC